MRNKNVAQKAGSRSQKKHVPSHKPDEYDNRKLRLDELTEEQLEIYSQNYQLVNLIRSGVHREAALKRLGIERSERSVRDLLSRYRKSGKLGLIDKRWFRENPTNVLTNDLQKIVLYYFFTYTAAGPRAIWTAACRACKSKKLPLPSESTVRKYLDSLPEALKMLRGGRGGERKWRHEAMPVRRYSNTSFGNDRWQADHTPLPIWIRVRFGKKWVPCHVFLTLFLDAHTRSIAGYLLSKKYPDSWSIALTLRRAILRKKNPKWKNRGIPLVFQTDQGKDFMSRAIAVTLANLGIVFDPDPPYYPNRKGKVERIFLTIDIGCLRILPGHMKAIGTSEGAAAKRVHELLTFEQLNAEIERWIVEEYHEKVHSETGRKPREFWEETVRLRMPTSDEDLNLLILKADQERTIRNTGLIFAHKGKKSNYWAPDLVYHYGERVRIAYNPEDLESILVYCASTGKFICEAFCMDSENPKYGMEDVRTSRNQFRKGLKTRISEYMEEIDELDRIAARQDEILEIRTNIEEETQIEEIPEDFSLGSEITDLLEEYRRVQRGEE